MNFFKYNTSFVNKTSADLVEIYDVVRGLEKYAKTIYKGRWEDALDIAFFHIIQNYDPSKGELENYATKVVSGVSLNQFRKEYPYEFISDLEDEKTGTIEGITITDRLDERNQRVDIENCIDYMIPFFIKDFKFFRNMETSQRKEKYSELFKKFNFSSISAATQYLRDNYMEDVEKFYELKKTCGGKRFSSDKLNKRKDTSMEYLGELNDTLIYRRKASGNSDRYFYKIDIKHLIENFLDKFYSQGGTAYVKIRDTIAYCTMRGEIVFSVEELMSAIERDLVGTTLSRTNLRVVHYDVGNKIILISTTPLEYNLNISVFKDEIWVEFESMPSKEMGKVGR